MSVRNELGVRSNGLIYLKSEQCPFGTNLELRSNGLACLKSEQCAFERTLKVSSERTEVLYIYEILISSLLIEKREKCKRKRKR